MVFQPRYKLPMRVGRISIEKFRNSVRLRFTLNGKTNCITIGRYCDDVLLAAVATAELINSDIAFQRFDETLAKYGKQQKQYAEVLVMPPIDTPKELNLKEIWEMYKELRPNTCQKTKESTWKFLDKWLNNCPSEYLVLNNAEKFFSWLRESYSDGSIAPRMRTLKASVNLAIELGKLERSNPFNKLYQLLDTTKKKQIKAFSKDEIRVIIDAFKSGRFDSNKSAYSSTYYTPLVEFRFLTGCRPSEAIALTWNDVKFNEDKVRIVFNKRYSSGQLLEGTKNGVTARVFTCNNQLAEFLKNLPRIPNKHNLVFPGLKGDYLDSGNFSGRHWRKIIKKLVELGEVKEYLPWYDERHTFGTHAVRHNPDLATISSIMGNSPETLMKHYLAPNDDGNYLPEI